MYRYAIDYESHGDSKILRGKVIHLREEKRGSD
jgi:hypothetical protein